MSSMRFTGSADASSTPITRATIRDVSNRRQVALCESVDVALAARRLAENTGGTGGIEVEGREGVNEYPSGSLRGVSCIQA